MRKNDQKAKGMVDISGKDNTKRRAVASGEIRLSAAAFSAMLKKGSPKGDIFEAARVAGVMAAKNTPTIIPYCHPLPLSKVNVSFEINRTKKSVFIKAEVVCLGQTGVEMEALTAVAAATLTIYDMMKWADKSMLIAQIMLIEKSGGQSGDYHRK